MMGSGVGFYRFFCKNHFKSFKNQILYDNNKVDL